MRELDLILGRFASQKIAIMRDDELDAFEKILSFEDSDLIGWLSGQVAIPPEYDCPLLHEIINYSERM